MTVSMRKVVAVSLTSQRIPWVTLAIMNVAFVVYYAAVMYSDKFKLGLMAGVLLAANLFGILIDRQETEP